MSHSANNQVNDRRAARLLAGDSLGASILLLVGLSGLQRMVGLLRNVLFCGLMSDDQLGRWSISYSFLLLAAPLAVLGLPGSFGRYVEHYRQRGQLRSFLCRTSVMSAAAALAATVLLILMPRNIAELLYNDPSQEPSVRLLGMALVAVIAFNFLGELLTALRLVRAVATMHLVMSLLFAGLGVSLLYTTPLNEQAVMISFGIASLVASLWGLVVVVRLYRALPSDETRLSNHDLCKKLLPFAGWIWVVNLVANLFAVSDQFMLRHFSGLNRIAADSLLGQYYCSRVVPLLFVGVAALLASSLLPHLTRDWEAGRRRTVIRRMNLALKLAAIGFTGAGALVLIGAPFLFTWLLSGKYDAGLAVLPGALTFCIWFSMFSLAYNYLLCVEKARLGSAALLLGLVANVGLNYLLAPRFGLPGVVLATATSNALSLGCVYLLGARLGMVWDRGVWLASALPVTLWLGGWASLAILSLVMAAGWQPRWVFGWRETRQASSLARQYAGKAYRLWKGQPAVE
ncbi:MAG: lipopolysaccharide biosynthesis protein [Pirellulaceae bacterium]